MKRSIYADSARQDFKAWIRRKESQSVGFRRDAEGELIAPARLDSDLTCVVALAAVKGKGPHEWTLETATITPTDEWRDVEEDCALLRRAIELFENSEAEVVLDNDLTQFVDTNFAPGWMTVVFEHPKTISIIVSAIPNDCGIETFPPNQLYREMLEGGIDALQNPDGRITPEQ